MLEGNTRRGGNENYQPTAQVIDSLYNIGSKCPLISGPCVYNARSLYEKFTRIILPDVNCPATEVRPSGNRENLIGLSQISVYPNPAIDNLVVNLPKSDEKQTFHLNIHNILGELILDQEIFFGENQVSVKNLPNGSFFVHILQGKQTISTIPVFIQH
jgi:hypothetical protein